MRNENDARRPRGFRSLVSDTAWAALAQEGARNRHRAGERLLHQGSPGGWVLLCLSGRLKVVYAEPDGREVLLAVRGPGDVLGELSGRDGRPRSATVQAIEPGITAKLSDRRFLDLADALGSREQLSAYIVGKMRESAPHAWQLAHRTTATRLAELITALIDAAGPDHPRPGTIAMSQEELAAALGLARSAITPVLARWKSAGLVRTARGRLEVPDPAALHTGAVSTSGQNAT
ncbi:Crp/Fnr family transcriptional regulator [Saccharopolyspora sp. HNM0983]|uniref:Crp/Fnr family transcriptional regulator n=1 Tax=Saccharopolyspora montiporae TaxID=2781240 RepID=A0A929FY46_9PSEU|nr:Crp/Fnr family transcriptional regulator [Saccharopolyspora sp. HNM0983]MBE9375366.1 Crp/Fnr family transcriptional regulator [Saccharopolyspora sp. HNM0983]